MKSLSVHLKTLVIILLLSGMGILYYQIFVEKRPITETEVENSWVVDAKIDLNLHVPGKVKLDFYVPPKISSNYKVDNELFVSGDFGQAITDVPPYNRKVTWSSRNVTNPQTLYYRAIINRNHSKYTPPIAIQNVPKIELAGVEKKIVKDLANDVRNKSTDITSFITLAINTVNDPNNSGMNLLLGKNRNIDNKMKYLEYILANGNIAIEYLHTINLKDPNKQHARLLLRSFYVNDLDEQNAYDGSWFYFDPMTGANEPETEDLIWWIGSSLDTAKLLEGNGKVDVGFSVTTKEMNAKQLMTLISNSGEISDTSFYNLPLDTQEAYKIMLAIPFGVLIILLLRNVVGIQTLGTFTPVLIALAFRQTGLTFGIIFFSTIVFFGLLIRSYLEHLRLQMLPRLSIVLTSVVGLIVFFGLISYKLNFQQGLSITLFPMVILTMTIERLSITWEERGANSAMKNAIGTLFTAALANFVMNYKPLGYFVFTFPAILLILVAFMLLMGRYTGYRLLELVRFKALLNKKD